MFTLPGVAIPKSVTLADVPSGRALTVNRLQVGVVDARWQPGVVVDAPLAGHRDGEREQGGGAGDVAHQWLEGSSGAGSSGASGPCAT